MTKTASPRFTSRRALIGRSSFHRLRASATALAGFTTLVFGATFAPHADAANDAWSTTPADGTFTGNNWTLGTTVPGAPTGTIASGDSLYFGTSSITTLLENEAAGFSIAGFTFNAGASAYTITGNSFALSGGITNNGTNLETINDAFTMAATNTFTTTAGGGNLALGGAISGAGGVTIAGAGTTTLSGALSYTGATTVNSGALTLTGTGTLGVVSVAPTGTGTLNLASTGTLSVGGSDYLVGVTSQAANNNALVATGVVNQTTGTFNGTGQLVLAAGSTAAFAGYNLSGGTLNPGTVRAGGVGNGAEGSSLFTQTGGTFTPSNYFIGRNSSGMNAIYLNGAGAVFTATTALTIGYVGTGTAVATVNAGTLTSTGALNLGNTANGTFTGTAILNLNGGTVRAPSLIRNAGTAIMNFNGGALQATAASTNYINGLTSANVYAGGARIDTNGFGITIAQPLLTTAGTTGITTIPVSNGGSGYVTAPLVNITGGTGAGATAVANLTGGVVTSITITSPGTGYTGAATVALIGGGAATPATLGTYTTGANAATDGGLTKIGAGTLTLTGTNTYNGGTTVNGGTLQLGFAAAGNNVLASGTALTLGGGTFNVNATAATGTVSQTLGNLAITGGANTITTTTSGATTSLNFTGTLTRSAGTVSFSPAASSSITLSNAANLGKAFLGNYAFFGTGATQTYAGTDATGLVQAATLTNAAGVNGLTSATGDYNYTSPGTPDLLTANRTADAVLFNTASAQTIDLNGANTLTLNSFLVTNGALTILNSGAGAGTLNVGTGNELLIGGSSAVNIAVPIANNGATASSLTDGNSGTLTLTGANTYTGVTTIGGGTLQIGNGGTTGTLSASSAIVDNGTLTFNRSDTVTQGTQFSTAGISGTGGLTQAGSGTLVLNANNTFTGPTTISAGTLTLGGAGTLGGGNYTSTILDNGAFNYNSTATQTMTGVISGTGTLTLNSLGSLTLTAINTFTGATTINTGTLVLTGTAGGAGALSGTPTITVNSGGTLVLTAQDTLGYTLGKEALIINSGGRVLNNGPTQRDTLQNTVTMTGGILGGSSAGDAAGVYSFDVTTAGSNTVLATSDAAGTAALINASRVQLQTANEIFNVTQGATAPAADLIITSAISGGNPFMKTGNGTLVLTGANTYTGITTVSAGTLAGTTTGLQGNITNNSALIFDQTLPTNAQIGGTALASGTYAGIISGTGTVTKNNAGTVIFNGANTYSGATAVNGGILYVNGSLNNASAISVASGARLGGTGTVGTATIASGGNVEGGQGSAGRLTLSGLTFNGTATAFIGNLSNYTTAPAIAAGALTANGAAGSVNLTISGSIPGVGTYQLLSYTGTIGGTGQSAFTLTTPLPNRATGSLDFTQAGLIDLNVTGSDFLIWTGGTTNTWDTTNPNFKLNSNGAATTYIDNPGDSVVFNDTAGAGHSTVNLNAGLLHPTSVAFNNSALNYVVQGTGGLTGTTGLTKTGTGSLTINTANSYTGTTTLGGGTVTLGNTGALGTTGPIIMSGGTLQYSTSNSVDYSSRFSAAANQAYNIDTNGQAVTYATALISPGSTLTKSGAGTLALSAISTISGGTTVNGGTLSLAAGGGTGAVQGTVTVNTGATLNLASGDALGYTAGGQVATVNVNGGTVTNGAGGNQGYLTNFNLTGGTVNAGGTFRFNVNAATPPGITSLASATTSTFGPTIDAYPGSGTAASLAINVASGTTASGIDLNIAGVILQSGGTAGLTGITKTGLGTLGLTGSSTFTGPTNINAGTVVIGAGGGLYTLGTVAGAVNVASGATLQFNRNDALGGSGAVSPVVVTVNGGTLAGNNTYTSLSNPVLNGATINSNGGTSVGFPGFSIRGTVMVGGTTPTNINAGTAGNGFNNVALGIANNGIESVTFNVADVTASPVSDLNVNTPFSNQGTGNGIIKTGAGTMMLAATNTYTGATTVNAGSLIVTGRISNSSAVTVNNAGSVLGGTGVIAGNITVGNGAILSAGNTAVAAPAVGTLTTGALTLSLGSTVNFLVANANSYSSLVNAFGSTDVSGAAFSISLTNGATFANGTVLQLIASDVGGTVFTNSIYTAGGYRFTADYNTDAAQGFFDVDVTAIPEPASWVGFVLMGIVGVSQRKRLKAWSRAARG